MTSRTKYRNSRGSAMLVAALFAVGLVKHATAQTPAVPAAPALPPWFHALLDSLEAGDNVEVRADSLKLTDATPTASFTVVNHMAHAKDLWLSLDCGASTDSARLTAPWHNQSRCAAPWISGVPQHVVLAPLASRTFTVHVDPPVTLPDGHYAVRLVWALFTTAVTPKGDTAGGVDHNAFRIIYDKGPQPPRRARTTWVATLPQARAAMPIRAAPHVVVLDAHTPTATVTLDNPGATPAEVWLMLDCPWFHVNNHNYPESSQFESAWHARIPNAMMWIGGFPQHLVLAPHERRTIPLTATPFQLMPGENISLGNGMAAGYFRAGVTPGSYYAQLLYVSSPQLAVTAAGDTLYTTPSGTVNVVYRSGAVSPLTLTALHRAPRADGTAQACVTIQQPGLGLVAVLHAAVYDPQGRPVRPRVTGHTRPPVWGLDTTVAISQVLLDDPLDMNVDGVEGQAKPPDPVCFRLPAFAPGHYRLAVSATALEDTGKDHPARATIPWESP